MSWQDDIWAAVFDAPAAVEKAEAEAKANGRTLTPEEREEAAQRGYADGVLRESMHRESMK